MNPGRRCLSLVKGRQRCVFRYSPGQELTLLGSRVEHAERPDVDFDFFDAAALGYQMGKRIGNTAERNVAISRPRSCMKVGHRFAQVSRSSQRRP
jgi:hypothetical protein